MKERDIEDVLVANTGTLGYENAPVIRNIALFPGGGRADVVLLPDAGQHRLVVIEVKLSSAADATDKVIGQLMKYYSNALKLGVVAIDTIRGYARDNPDSSCDHQRTMPGMIFGKKKDELTSKLKEGRRLRPAEIALYVAMDGPLQPPLKRILTTLSVHHDLRIGVIRVEPGGIRILAGADVSDRMD